MPESDWTSDRPLEDDEVRFFGQIFRMAERVGKMPVLKFSKIALDDAASDVDEASAMYDLLEACFHADDWRRFEKAATVTGADEEELFDVIRVVLRAQSARPTRRPSDSSPGPSHTEQSSTSTPADRAIARLAGRPDLQVAVDNAQKMQRTA